MNVKTLGGALRIGEAIPGLLATQFGVFRDFAVACDSERIAVLRHEEGTVTSYEMVESSAVEAIAFEPRKGACRRRWT